jgi:hypothetical protein
MPLSWALGLDQTYPDYNQIPLALGLLLGQAGIRSPVDPKFWCASATKTGDAPEKKISLKEKSGRQPKTRLGTRLAMYCTIGHF